MKYVNVFFFSVLFFFSVQQPALAVGKKNVKIYFVAKDGDRARTYLGKLTKGELNSLKYELQRYKSTPVNEVDVLDDKAIMEGYVNSITVGGEKKDKKGLSKSAMDDLIGNYEIKDTISLAEAKEKKKKAAAEKASKRSSSANYKRYKQEATRSHAQLDKYYKVRKTRRLRDGSKFSAAAGPNTFIVVYDVAVDRKILSYIDVVDIYLNPDSKYNLKYHGTGANRQYYIEYETKKKSGKK
jgi:hypothetical protein